MSWKILPIQNPTRFSNEVIAFAKELALAEALKQAVDLQDLTPDVIERLGQKWQNHFLVMQKSMGGRYGEQLDDLLILAWRVNRFAHHFEAALIRRTLELSGKEPTQLETALSTAKGCEKRLFRRSLRSCRSIECAVT